MEFRQEHKQRFTQKFTGNRKEFSGLIADNKNLEGWKMIKKLRPNLGCLKCQGKRV